MSSRPILVIADNPELANLVAAVEGASVAPLDSPEDVAGRIETSFHRGRQQKIERNRAEFETRTAAERFARILDRIAGQSMS